MLVSEREPPAGIAGGTPDWQELGDLPRNRSQLEAQRERGATLGTAGNIDGSAVQPHDFRYDGQAEASPAGTLSFAAPKPFKYPLPI